ncbi:MAPK protein hog1, partial [Coelomomyces lativittatus]
MLTHLNSLIYWETSPPPSSSSSSSSSFQKHNLFGNIFEVPPEFTELKPIGVGSYGFVCSAKHTRLKMGVAIKKLLQPFQTSDHAKGAYREIRLLKTLKHDNIIQLLDAYISPSDD